MAECLRGSARTQRVKLFPLAALAAVTAVVATSRPADACWNDYTHDVEVLGVAPDGWFATAEMSWSEAGDGAENQIVVRDADGEAVETFSLVNDSPDWRRQIWKYRGVKGAKRAARLAKLDLGHMSVRQARTKVTASMKLTPLAADPARFRHVKSAVRCGSIERETKSGFVRVADVGELDFHAQFCPPITVQGFSHPASKLEFVRWKWAVDQGDVQASRDEFRFYPKTLVDGIELAVRGERALNAGKAVEARALLTKSVALAPQYFPSRHALVRASAKAKGSWADLEKSLQTPIPDGTSCIAWADHRGPETLSRDKLPWKEADPLIDDASTWPWFECNRESQYYFRVDEKGDAVE